MTWVNGKHCGGIIYSGEFSYLKAQDRIKEIISILENKLGHKMEGLKNIFENSHWDMHCVRCDYYYRVIINSKGQGEAWIKLMENGRAVEKACWSEWTNRPYLPMEGNCNEMAIREVLE